MRMMMIEIMIIIINNVIVVIISSLSVDLFEFCCKMLYFMNALARCYETLYGSSTRSPEGTLEVSSKHHLVLKSNIYMLLTLNLVDFYFLTGSKFDFDSEILAEPNDSKFLPCGLAFKILLRISSKTLVRLRRTHHRKIGNVSRCILSNGQISIFW